MLKKTPLNAVHRAAGARMVDFGGWDMPVHYGSQIDEHHAVRGDAGMFDVSHMRAVDLAAASGSAGPREFLRHALANNVDKLAVPGKALYSCLLREDGGVLDDLIVYFLREDFFRIVVNAGTADKDIAWFRQLLAQRAPDLTLTPRDDLAMIAVQGPNARAKVWQALPGSEPATSDMKPFFGREVATAAGPAFVARTGYTGEDGFEIMVPAARAAATWDALVAAGVRPCGLGARDTLRLEAGMNLYGQDMDEIGVAARGGTRVDGRSREPARLRRQGRARCASARAAPGRPAAAGSRRRAPRAPGRAHGPRRRRDHQRHVQPHARQVDRAGARARGGGGRRRRARRRARQAARGARREAAVRAQRQGAGELSERQTWKHRAHRKQQLRFSHVRLVFSVLSVFSVVQDLEFPPEQTT